MRTHTIEADHSAALGTVTVTSREGTRTTVETLTAASLPDASAAIAAAGYRVTAGWLPGSMGSMVATLARTAAAETVIPAERAEILTAGAEFGDQGDTVADGYAGVRIGSAVIVGGTDEVRAMLAAALADLDRVEPVTA